MRIHTSWLAAAASLAVASSTVAQAPATPERPSFEVASVKPNKSVEAGRGGLAQPGRFVRTANTLRQLIRAAYSRPFEHLDILGGPGWLDSDLFDIEGKGSFSLADYVPRGNNPPAVYLMLQSLLAERFKLAVHMETRQLPVYDLVMANQDGKFGPRLQRSNVDCDAMINTFAKTGQWPTPPAPGQAPPCSTGTFSGKIVIEDLSMPQIANILAGPVDRVVKDRTALPGNFDLTLEWAPDELARNSGGASIFTALQEQLGLKLVSTRGPVDVLVIDRAEHPTPD